MLILLRHARAEPGTAAMADEDRPLSPRGRADAARIGDWLRILGLPPLRVACSPSRRTRQTLDALHLDAPATFPDALYLADAETILAHAGPVPTLIVAHNPGIAGAARHIAITPPDHPAFDAYPPGACTILRDGQVLAFHAP
jgi:phosphohistidine phosphatase